MKEPNCIFCKIAGGEIPSKTIYEDDEFRVILDISPATKGHALILPKQHYADLYEIPEEVVGRVMKLAKKLAGHMTDVLKCDGFNIVQINGEAAGQTVFHFHRYYLGFLLKPASNHCYVSMYFKNNLILFHHIFSTSNQTFFIFSFPFFFIKNFTNIKLNTIHLFCILIKKLNSHLISFLKAISLLLNHLCCFHNIVVSFPFHNINHPFYSLFLHLLLEIFQ